MVHIIRGKKNLSKFLIKNRELSDKAFSIVLDKSESSKQLLREYNIGEAIYDNLAPGEREQFLEEYINLIGMVGRECNSRYWWATDMSSKNRSTCRLPFILHEFLFVIRSISEMTGELIIVNPSWVILNSLKQFMTGKNIEFSIVGDNAERKEPAAMKVRNLARVFYVTFRVIWRRLYFSTVLRKKLCSLIRNGKYYVIKTFLYDHSFDQNGKYRDTFFGIIPDFLNGRENVLVLADVLGKTRSLGRAMKRCDSHLMLPLEIFLPIADIVRMAGKAIRGKISLTGKYLFFGYDVSGIIRAELNRTGDGIAFYQFLHYPAIKRLLEKIRIGTFLLTYENNPWEKMCMMALKESPDAGEIIGYQHSVVPQSSANAFISRYESDIIPIPDRILTVGEMPKRIMERFGSFEPGRIKPACGLRFEYLFKTVRHPRKSEGHIFLALEGLEGAHKLLNYAMENLMGKANYKVRFRTHPEMPLHNFRHKLAYSLQHAPNFRQTENTLLKDDLAWADVVVYWGSTVSLEAILTGRPLVRYNMDTVLNYDPLFECDHLKWTVNDNTSLIHTFEQIYSLDDATFDGEWFAAKEYISQYFFPITRERLQLFMSEQ